MRTYARVALAIVIPLLVAPVVSAQEPRFAVAVKGGVSAESSEDGLSGTVPALGGTGSVNLTPKWRGEVEFWLPAYLKDEDGEPRHRDILASVSVVRMLRAGPARPFLVAGLSISRTQDWLTFCTADRMPGTGGAPVRALVSCDEPDVIDRRRERNDGTDGYVLVGGGVEMPLAPRVHLVADIRVSLAPASVVVRPAVGVAVGF
jgi:hypothetical protein